MPYLACKEDSLYYHEWGKAGAPVIFVHGSCGGGGQWKALATSLSDEFRCFCPDNPGLGGSGPWPKDRIWSSDDDEAALKGLMDMIGAPAHLVVHSGGGHFAYSLIRDRSADLLSVTMFESVYFHLLRQSGDPLFSEPQGMAQRYRAFTELGRKEEALADFVDSWARKKGCWSSLPEPVRTMMRTGADRLYHEWNTLWFARPDVSDLAALDLPVLLFMGSDTIPSMVRVCAAIADAIPTCRFIEIEGAGHMSPFTHHQIALGPMRDHLQRAQS